ncbi:MAG: hypothetical protein CIT01_03060 [Methanobacterium sp. BRmetb2]|nr:MAG: hypothetical protein CIT01_03060 [Methanobacterium sp. BRmetb2]
MIIFLYKKIYDVNIHISQSFIGTMYNKCKGFIMIKFIIKKTGFKNNKRKKLLKDYKRLFLCENT